MRKRFAAILLAMLAAAALLVSACAPAGAPTAQETQSDTGTAESTAVSGAVGEPSAPETARTEETLGAAETEGADEAQARAEAASFAENCDRTPRSVSLYGAALWSEDSVWALGGNKVYFGQYDGSPMVYRVLASPDTQTAAEGRRCLLLDCDTTLALKAFDDNFKKNDGQAKLPSEWKGSDIELWLNGGDFYENSAVFSPVEKAAIASTTLAADNVGYTIGNWTYTDCGSTDHVFLLSAGEANGLYADNAARAKDGSSICWWLRSALDTGGNGSGSIHGDGHVCNNSISNFGVGISPALNVKLSSILFASAVGTDKSLDLTEAGAKVTDSAAVEWKLTLLDTGKTIKVPEGQNVTRTETGAGTVIAVPYAYTGSGVTQISVIITDQAYPDGCALALYYGALQRVPAGSETGTGYFTLPADLENQSCGADYYVYLTAEDVNAEQETDYAGEFYPIAVPAAAGAEEPAGS